jgi:hypothetical protein
MLQVTRSRQLDIKLFASDDVFFIAVGPSKFRKSAYRAAAAPSLILSGRVVF